MLPVKLIEPPCTERYARWCERSRIYLKSLPTRLSGESYKEFKEDYLAFMITMVDILNGAAYLFDKKPDSDNRHWKEQKEIQEYCEAISKEVKVKEIKNQL